MNYGIPSYENCFLTNIVDQLHESFKKISIADSGVVKPESYKFEFLGRVRNTS